MDKFLIKFDKWVKTKARAYVAILIFCLLLTLVSLFDQYAFNNALQVSYIFDDFVRSNLVNPYDMAFFYFICLSAFFLDRYKQTKALTTQEL